MEFVRTRARAQALALAFALPAVGTLAAGCSAEDELADELRASAEAPEAGDPVFLGRVHLIIEPRAGEDRGTPLPDGDDEPQVQVTARFIQFRGVEESFVRSRLDLRALEDGEPALGECRPSDANLTSAAEAEQDDDEDEDRDILLLDAGNIGVRLGELRFDLTLALVPDLLPYMAGVEYVHTVDRIDALLPGDEPGAITIEVDGGGDDELPGFTHHADMPPPFTLEGEVGAFDRDVIELSWNAGRSGQDGEPVSLVLSSYSSAGQTGREITCVVPDSGDFTIELPELRRLGLGGPGDVLQIQASRVWRSQFNAGDFSDGEVLVELRDRHALQLP